MIQQEKSRLEGWAVVAGTGRDCGKTTFVCSLLQKFTPSREIAALKISPHVHRHEGAGRVIASDNNYYLAEELDTESTKDSSRYLRAGACRSFIAFAGDESVPVVIEQLKQHLPEMSLVICESAAVGVCYEPDLLFLIEHNEEEKRKRVDNGIRKRANFCLSLDETNKILPPDKVIISNGEWKIEGYEKF